MVDFHATRLVDQRPSTDCDPIGSRAVATGKTSAIHKIPLYHQSPSITINPHHLHHSSSILVNHHQSSSILINLHQSPTIIHHLHAPFTIIPSASRSPSRRRPARGSALEYSDRWKLPSAQLSPKYALLFIPTVT